MGWTTFKMVVGAPPVLRSAANLRRATNATRGQQVE
jgi:hypothetical protein